MKVGGVGTVNSSEKVSISTGAENRAENVASVKTSDAGQTQVNGKKEAADQKTLDKAIEQLNSTSEIVESNLKFEKHQASGEWMVKVVNTTNGDVIRTIPSEETLNMIAGIKQLLGTIFDKKA